LAKTQSVTLREETKEALASKEKQKKKGKKKKTDARSPRRGKRSSSKACQKQNPPKKDLIPQGEMENPFTRKNQFVKKRK